MIPATVPYDGRLHREVAAAAEHEQHRGDDAEDADRDRPLAVGGILVPARRIAEVDEQREPDEDHDGADHLAAPDVLLRQEVAEREREDDRS